MLESWTWTISKERWKPSVGLFRKRPPWADEEVAGRVERRKKALSNNYPLFFSTLFYPSHFIFKFSLLCMAAFFSCTFICVDWTVFILIGLLTKAFFADSKRHMYLYVTLVSLFCAVHKVDVILWREATWGFLCAHRSCLLTNFS